MKNGRFRMAVLAFALCVGGIAPSLASGPVGFTVGFSLKEKTSVCDLDAAELDADLIQPPLLKPYDRTNMDWWYNLVEEAAFANASYIAPGIRGTSCGPADSEPFGDASPTWMANLVQALETRGYTDILKVALFDPMSWYPGHLGLCANTSDFDMSRQDYWQQYIWTNNWEPFFQNVTDQHRMKIQGRPLVIMWSVGSGLGFSHTSGHLAALLQFLRGKCQAEFGFNPFIVVDQSWASQEVDPYFGNAADGVNNWFNFSSNWSLRSYVGQSGTFTTGVVAPGFWKCEISGGVCTTGQRNFIDRQGGQALRTGLANTSSADLVLIEGQTDAEENAGLYRASLTCYPGCKGYSLPQYQCWSTNGNLYLNIVREFTAPNPQFVVFEAEAVDAFSTLGLSPTGLYRRDGALQINYTDSTHSDWSVVLNPSETLTFSSFALGASNDYRLGVRYGSARGATGRLLVDGVTKATIGLAGTGGESVFSSYTLPAGFAVAQGSHDVTLALDSGTASVDNWVLNGFSSGPTCPAASPTASFVVTPNNPGVGEVVTFTNSSTGCPTAVSWVFGDGGSSTATSSTHVYSPGGTYSVTLTVSNSYGSSSLTTSVAVSATVALALAGSPAPPQHTGTSITWTVTPASWLTNLQYEFWVYNPNTGQWTIAQPYSNATTFNWTPSQSGQYWVQVWARRIGSTASYDAWQGSSACITDSSASPTINSFVPSPAPPVQVGTQISFTATATGGVAPLQYEFWIYSYATGVWTLGQGYSASPTFNWTPTQPGQYSIQVWVRNSGSCTAYDAWTQYAATINP